MQLTNKLSQEGVTDSPETFNLLGNALRSLRESKNIQNLRLQFEIKLLYTQGVLPPDFDARDFLQRPLSEHDQFEIHWEQLSLIRSRTHHVLNQYLNW